MSLIELEQIDPYISILYLNNPETKNSMTLQMGEEFYNTLKDLSSKSKPIRVLIITGKNNVFSSGGDLNLLKSFASKPKEENQKFMKYFYSLFLEVRNCPFIVIAAVNGHAIGASLSLALACDLRYFIPDGKYAFNFVKIGIHPGMGSSFLVKEIAGIHQAQELLFTGRIINGEEAYQRGLCHGLFSQEEILERTIEIAKEIANNAPQPLRMLKHNLYRAQSLEEALEKEAVCQAENFTKKDFIEAIRSIEEKRKPEYKDE
ncbi:MAG: enoyl-CoA hydratase [Leptospiraceae bacterium]|nr:MAG: enoyl-CoA hydratase [Leptospiraceae bacterium]